MRKPGAGSIDRARSKSSGHANLCSLFALTAPIAGPPDPGAHQLCVRNLWKSTISANIVVRFLYHESGIVDTIEMRIRAPKKELSMKKFTRIMLVAAALFVVAPMSSFAAPLSAAPHPPASSVSISSAAVAAVPAVPGL